MKTNRKNRKKKDLIVLQLIVGCVGAFIISVLVGRFLGSYVIEKFPQYSPNPKLKLNVPKDAKVLIKKKVNKERSDIKYKLQVMAVKNYEGAMGVVEKLKEEGYEATIRENKRGSLYRIIVNVYNVDEVKKLKEMYPDCFVVDE